MKTLYKSLAALGVIALAAGVYWKTRPPFFDTGNPLQASGPALDLLAELDSTENLPEGWRHRKFLRYAPADYTIRPPSEEMPARQLHCATDGSGSILARDTDIALADLPILSWQWQVTTPVDSPLDEATREGDDHPLRFYIRFTNDAGEGRAMEIIWSNRKYAPGDYKIIGDFHHYVAGGLPENVGPWHANTLDLRQIYADIGGTGAGRIDTLGFFCDTDNTGATSAGSFAAVTLSAPG
ncbi:DUF3047 domain-containing protein [Alphaproteobacteria bacterium KMM 3653]|uniref:DUF3047 domain-containing protein n=1 Tax=Harenicola maris TaxID=2841044 RepID=A0AAP2CNM0_9RHOB|nr:DUF3047 domain-containing protein [Harenicola maris]